MSPRRAAVLILVATAAFGGCATTRLPRSYAEAPSWARYPAELRLPADDPRLHEETWSWRGHDVHLDVWTPTKTKSPQTTVLLLHGAGGHGRLLAGFAQPLVEAGHEVIAPDLPLYGLTRVALDSEVTLGTWVECVAELARVRRRPGVPLVVFGASLGGTVALYAAAMNPTIDGVLATTLLDLRDPDILRAVATSSTAVDLMISVGWMLPRGFPLEAQRLAPLDRMTPDKAIVDALLDDPLIGRREVPLGFFRSFLDVAPARPLAAIQTPVLLVHPEADRWTPVELSKPTFDALGGEKELVLLKNAGHLPMEMPGRVQLKEAALAFLSRLASDDDDGATAAARGGAPRTQGLPARRRAP